MSLVDFSCTNCCCCIFFSLFLFFLFLFVVIIKKAHVLHEHIYICKKKIGRKFIQNIIIYIYIYACEYICLCTYINKYMYACMYLFIYRMMIYLIKKYEDNWKHLQILFFSFFCFILRLHNEIFV